MLSFLHTAEAHVETFSTLVAVADPATETRHVVAPHLLALARKQAPQFQVELAAAIADLSGFAVCTCSTIGAAFETEAARIGLAAMRIDRPMAEAACRLGQHIGIAACLDSTIEPTRNLLESCAPGVETEFLLFADCWPLFEAWRIAEFHEEIAKRLRENARNFDVIVLAQASMAGAVDLVDLPTPILSSPKMGVATALAKARIVG